MSKISAQKAINNHCKGCIYDPLAGGTWREQVERCTITICELFEHRPRSAEYKRKAREEYLLSLTPEQLALEKIKEQNFRNKVRKFDIEVK